MAPAAAAPPTDLVSQLQQCNTFLLPADVAALDQDLRAQLLDWALVYSGDDKTRPSLLGRQSHVAGPAGAAGAHCTRCGGRLGRLDDRTDFPLGAFVGLDCPGPVEETTPSAKGKRAKATRNTDLPKPEDRSSETAAGDRYDQVAIALLDPSPLNPRKRFDERHIAELQRSIEAARGVLVPLLLRPAKKGRFEIVDGERRFHALQRLAQVTNTEYGAVFRSAPAVIRALSDSEVLEIQLTNAIQRQDLTPLEEAAGYKALIDSNPSHYSPAYIADKIGRSEKYVVDRMRLLQLEPILKKLLEAERILVGHAELLCRLKPEDQQRAVGWERESFGRAGRDTGLWQSENDRLRLDEDDDDEPSAKNLYRGLKPVTVKELESWIAHHVRFDVEHAAATAPLDFGPVAKAVEEAKAAPGRGRKVIAITDQYRVDDDARDPTERTYGRQSYERADGKEKSKTCEYSVLGVYVAGPHYGTTQRVCINRDKCTVHWAKVIKEREKNAKLRAAGQGSKAAAREKKERESFEAQERKREAQEKRDAAEYAAFYPLFVEALKAKLPTTFNRRAFEYVYDGKAPSVPPAKFVEALVMHDVERNKPGDYGADWRKQRIVAIAKHWGVDVKALDAKAKAAVSAPAPGKPAAAKKKGGR